MSELKNKIFTFSFIIISFFSFGQSADNAEIYREEIYTHTNTDLLVTGETLYYSIYCLQAGKTRFSALSKIAYVELIGENEKPVLQSKVSLDNGTGSGDFFLSSTLPSGNYTLIVYTKWMRNFPMEYFFQKQITIINPFLKSFNPQNKVVVITSAIRSERSKKHTTKLQLVADKKSYRGREKVILIIKNNDEVNDCNLSLNVHSYYKTDKKADSLNEIRLAATSDFQKTDKVKIVMLPDLRGETVSGRVVEKGTRQFITNSNIYLSVPGSVYVFQTTETDSTGRFYFSAKNIQSQNGIQFSMDNTSEAPYEVILDKEFIDDYGNFKPSSFLMDTILRKQIEQRNIYSQVENAYYGNKRDSVITIERHPFYGSPDKVYNLDEFTRFPTMEDVFREYVTEVAVSIRNKKFIIQMVNGRNSIRFLGRPLILVDGIPVFDNEVVMNYNPLLVKRISLVTKRYLYAGLPYDGILSLETYSGNAKELPITSTRKDYTSWQRTKYYYTPIYETGNHLERIPDYRIQLYWNPAIHIEPGKEIKIEFYTSDVNGDFLVEAKGFNSIGEPVNLHYLIEVKK